MDKFLYSHMLLPSNAHLISTASVIHLLIVLAIKESLSGWELGCYASINPVQFADSGDCLDLEGSELG
uniref:Uncharacterized protein n=1 Tax=Chelonoidis abingdonii TaxID=106734 RepID=A0A8C0HAW1_CHEAB